MAVQTLSRPGARPQAGTGRVGVIDIGSNSIRLVVFAGNGRSPMTLFNEKVLCGLGRGLDASGRLNEAGVKLALENLARFVWLARAMEVTRLDLLATAAVPHTGPERWHPDPRIFYAPGGGPILDVGPYFVTALVHLLGPVESVASVGRGLGSQRVVATGALAGTAITSEVPTTVIGTLTFESGVIGSLFASFDAAGSRVPSIEIHGTEGSLSLGDPNRFDGEVLVRRIGAKDWEDIPLRFRSDVERGIGLADMIEAMRSGRPHRASGELAYHVLDVLLALAEATTTGRTERIASRVEPPQPLG